VANFTKSYALRSALREEGLSYVTASLNFRSLIDPGSHMLFKRKIGEKTSYLIVSIIFFILAAISAFIVINTHLNILNVKNWVETSCTIDNFQTWGGRTSSTRIFKRGFTKIKIKYHYTFNDINYHGQRYNLSDQNVPSKVASNLKETYRIGSRKSCYINPLNPNQSVINPKYDIALKEIILYYYLPWIIFLATMSINFFLKSRKSVA